MKNASLILNAVLAVAVVVLYVLHFSSGKPSTSDGGSVAVNPGDLKIAYVVEDSVLKYYDYFKISRDKLEAKAKKYDQDLTNRQNGLRREIEQYQANQGALTIGQAQAIEKELGNKQQNLQMYQQTLSQDMMNEESKISEALYEKITSYLKKYGEERGLQIVLKLDRSSDVLYGGKALDITKEVTDGLNEAYKAESANPSTKADSTTAK